MIDPPQPLDRGVPPRLRDWLNRLRDFAAANKPLPGPACNVYRGTNGSLIDPIPAPSAAGGEAVDLQPFELVYFRVDDTHKVRVKYSTLAGVAPTSPTPNDQDDWEFTFADGNKIYGKVVVNQTTGAVSARTLHSAASVPADTNTDFHVEIGTMWQTGSGDSIRRGTTNARYGPIDATICRNWYASAAPYFGLNWQ